MSRDPLHRQAQASLPLPGVPLQVHLRCEELKLIPQQARMKRRQKSRMLVNASSGWPALCTQQAAKCVWHQTIIFAGGV